MTPTNNRAPGAPGIPPRWTSSAKSGVGTSLNLESRVWFTLSHGIFDEIYYSRVDQACTRDMGMIVTDGKDFFSEEKRDARHQIEYLSEGVPAFRIVSTCLQGRYRIEKHVLTDPSREVILQFTRFEPLIGNLEDYHLYVLLAPHLGNQGAGNTAWLGDYKGNPMLFAQRDGDALALSSSAPWLKRSAGFVGISDGWQDLHEHKRMEWEYNLAENGNVALTGEIDLANSEKGFILALGFGRNDSEAGQRALASLMDGFDHSRSRYLDRWQRWQTGLLALDGESKNQSGPNFYRVSTAVLRTHEAKRFPGGIIASLSIPWGFDKGDDDLGGYHLVWPRDLVEAAGALIAAGAPSDARRVLDYLQVTQEADGSWPQNMWLDGRPYWSGIQMDETAFPILLANLADQQDILKRELDRYWPMIRKAASFLVQNGPVTPQDRWEEDSGYSPFTLAVEIAALLIAADLADRFGEPEVGNFLRETADAWNASIEDWIYVRGTSLAKKVGVDGYYVRIAPAGFIGAASLDKGFVPIKNQPPGQSDQPADLIVSPDALALVRFGLRAPDDPRILNTIKVIDEVLKVETPNGPAWHRYNQDQYGEHDDGSSYDGIGVGRAWPLLTGERAHFELAAGHHEEAIGLMHAMEAFANSGGLIPEQIWDSADIPERELFCGQPSGSAMPLVWAHAEYVKLRRSLSDGRVFDLPDQTVKRYVENQTESRIAVWQFNQKIREIPLGKTLRVEILAPALIHWSDNDWDTTRDTEANDSGLGVYFADLPTADLPVGSKIAFTFYWIVDGTWEEQDFRVRVVE